MRLVVTREDGSDIFDGEADGAAVEEGALRFVTDDDIMYIVPLTAFEFATLDLPMSLGDDEEDNL